MGKEFSFTVKIWIYSSTEAASWYFLSVPKEYTEEIKARTSDYPRGFGSVKVTASIGVSTWKTSIFPDSKLGCYILPVKKEIRVKESLAANQEVSVAIELQH